MDNKQIAIAFLTNVTKGNIAHAYEAYVSPTMRHHNAYFPGDVASLRKGMEESHVQFPRKQFTIKQVIAEGDFVAVHSHLELEKGKEVAVIHWFRFANNKIVELWDIGQLITPDAVNSMF
jgi:predicted SnoaL-like aldol condensation-catalyzing enzyme